MDIDYTYELKPHQRANPVVEVIDLNVEGVVQLPEITLDEFHKLFKPGKRALKTWGRTPGRLINDPHWLGTVGGTPLHIDPRYPRYSHHLKIMCVPEHSVSGMDKVETTVKRGVYYVLDAHSPHIVHAPKDGVNLAVTMDFHDHMPSDYVIDRLLTYANEAQFLPTDPETIERLLKTGRQ